MAATFRHGKGAYFSLSDNTGTTINLSSGLEELTLSRSVDTAETSTFGDNDKSYIAGLRDATISGSLIFASTHEEKLSASLGHSTALTWVFGPESTANTRRKFTGSGILTGWEGGASIGDKVTSSFELQVTGAITATTF